MVKGVIVAGLLPGDPVEDIGAEMAARLAAETGETPIWMASGPDLFAAGARVDPGGIAGPELLDPGAMGPARLRAVLGAATGPVLVTVSGGYLDGPGSAARLAEATGLPVVLALAAGGAVETYAALLAAPALLGVPGLPKPVAVATTPTRGLATLGPLPVLDLADAAAALPLGTPKTGEAPPQVSPPGQRIAIARDAAFGGPAAHVLADWQAAGSAILPFSPLEDAAPDGGADVVLLWGGHPYRFAKSLARAGRYRRGVAALAGSGVAVHGAGHGAAVLGRRITDPSGIAYPGLDLLPLETSYHGALGAPDYVTLEPAGLDLFGPSSCRAVLTPPVRMTARSLPPAFATNDRVTGSDAARGLVLGNVSGSFAQITDIASD